MEHFESFEIIDTCDGSYGYRDGSQNEMAGTILVQEREHTIKVSIDLTYHFKKVNATFRFFEHLTSFALFPWKPCHFGNYDIVQHLQNSIIRLSAC